MPDSSSADMGGRTMLTRASVFANRLDGRGRERPGIVAEVARAA